MFQVRAVSAGDLKTFATDVRELPMALHHAASRQYRGTKQCRSIWGNHRCLPTFHLLSFRNLNSQE